MTLLKFDNMRKVMPVKNLTQLIVFYVQILTSTPLDTDKTAVKDSTKSKAKLKLIFLKTKKVKPKLLTVFSI